ncbi:hypothetical protein MRB53_037919 [Persea americana]|nr:hypothetical protein MRB53_037919 [Persea americana]
MEPLSALQLLSALVCGHVVTSDKGPKDRSAVCDCVETVEVCRSETPSGIGLHCVPNATTPRSTCERSWGAAGECWGSRTFTAGEIRRELRWALATDDQEGCDAESAAKLPQQMRHWYSSVM